MFAECCVCFADFCGMLAECCGIFAEFRGILRIFCGILRTNAKGTRAKGHQCEALTHAARIPRACAANAYVLEPNKRGCNEWGCKSQKCGKK